MKILIEESVLREALEALDSKYIVGCGAWQYQKDQAITALRSALDAAEKVEPVAWCLEVYDFAEMVTDKEIYTEQVKGNAIPLYTHPAPAVPEETEHQIRTLAKYVMAAYDEGTTEYEAAYVAKALLDGPALMDKFDEIFAAPPEGST